MEFFEAPAFTRHLSSYLDEEQFGRLPSALADAPQLGNVIPGTGGFRKLRWADAQRVKGRCGGLRVIYYWFDEHNQIWLLTIYGKNEAIDLTAEQRKALKAAIATEKKLRLRK